MILTMTHSVGSGYEAIDAAPNPDDYVRRLDLAASTDFWRGIKQLSFELMRLRSTDHVLDIGCGTGDDVRALSGLTSRAVGVDSSATMVAEARRRSEGRRQNAEFHVANALQLPFADGTFDACRIERVLQHIRQPELAIREMVRVCCSGARVVTVEPDYATLSIVGADRHTTRRILECRQAHFASPRIGSQLPGVLRANGLGNLVVKMRVLESHDFAADRARLSKYAQEAVEAGAIHADERVRWLAELQASAAKQAYRQAAVVFVVASRRD
jgi:ubiquinone/menaquinone biosynthesis C-methylase UbiE